MSQYDALIVAHGQPSDPKAAELALAQFSAEIESFLPGFLLGSATLAAPDALETKLGNLREGGVVYPLFMTDGWFVKTTLANRLGDAKVKVMSPFGMADDLIALTAEALRATAGFGKGPLLIVAHGSASGRIAPAQVPHEFARQLREALGGYPLKLGFVEQEPLLSDVAETTPDAAMCLPFLAMEGEHVRKDVRKSLDGAGFMGEMLPVISQLPGMSRMIAACIQAELVKQSISSERAA